MDNTPVYIALVVLIVICIGLAVLLVRKSPVALQRFEDAVANFEPKVEDTLQGLLTKAELRLTSTDDEDGEIEHANRNIARAVKQKQAKRAALENHVAKLQAHLTSLGS